MFTNYGYMGRSLAPPNTDKTIVGNAPAFAPDFLLKGGISFQKGHCFRHSFNGCLRLTAILAGYEYWQRANPESANSSLQGFQPFGGLVYHQASALDCRHLESDRRKVLRSRICQWNRAGTTSLRLRWSVPVILTGTLVSTVAGG
jgi:hypothetical protein